MGISTPQTPPSCARGPPPPFLITPHIKIHPPPSNHPPLVIYIHYVLFSTKHRNICHLHSINVTQLSLTINPYSTFSESSLDSLVSLRGGFFNKFDFGILLQTYTSGLGQDGSRFKLGFRNAVFSEQSLFEVLFFQGNPPLRYTFFTIKCPSRYLRSVVCAMKSPSSRCCFDVKLVFTPG
jgi:hypothetical protein